MPTAADCWAYARECQAWAARLYDEQDRKIFLEMAKALVELALKEQSAFRTTSSAKPGREDRQPALHILRGRLENPGCGSGSRFAVHHANSCG